MTPAMWTAAGWVLVSLFIGNAWACWANLRRAEALDDLADEMNRDRAQLLEAARVLSEDRKSLDVFVALNDVARCKGNVRA